MQFVSQMNAAIYGEQTSPLRKLMLAAWGQMPCSGAYRLHVAAATTTVVKLSLDIYVHQKFRTCDKEHFTVNICLCVSVSMVLHVRLSSRGVGMCLSTTVYILFTSITQPLIGLHYLHLQ
jgi:hypothetical protein